MNANWYQENILDKHVKTHKYFKKKGVRGWHFIQDSAKSHTAKKTKEYIERNKINFIQLSPKSPDLNPIEQIWAFVKDEYYKKRYDFPNNKLGK